MTTPLKTRLSIHSEISRSEVRVYRESVANEPFPSWFNPATGLILFSGCGGGGGAGGADGITVGSGGGSGAFAIKHPIVVPPNSTGLAIYVGVGGTGGLPNTGNGGTGGNTYVRALPANESIVTLKGGGGGQSKGGLAAPFGYGGEANFYTTKPHRFSYGAPIGWTYYFPKAMMIAVEQVWSARIPTLFNGFGGYRTPGNFNKTSIPTNNVARTPFGGFDTTKPPYTLLDGYGYGGRAGLTAAWANGDPGGPGIVILEFIEGLN